MRGVKYSNLFFRTGALCASIATADVFQKRITNLDGDERFKNSINKSSNNPFSQKNINEKSLKRVNDNTLLLHVHKVDLAKSGQEITGYFALSSLSLACSKNRQSLAIECAKDLIDKGVFDKCSSNILGSIAKRVDYSAPKKIFLAIQAGSVSLSKFNTTEEVSSIRKAIRLQPRAKTEFLNTHNSDAEFTLRSNQGQFYYVVGSHTTMSGQVAHAAIKAAFDKGDKRSMLLSLETDEHLKWKEGNGTIPLSEKGEVQCVYVGQHYSDQHLIMSLLAMLNKQEINGCQFETELNLFPGGPGSKSEIEQLRLSLSELNSTNLPVVNVVEGKVIKPALDELQALYEEKGAQEKYKRLYTCE